MKRSIYVLLALSIHVSCFAQPHQLKPGFDAKEYIDMLSLFEKHIDSGKRSELIPKTENYIREYRSPEGPLKNRWELWLRNDHVAVINIRGTTSEAISWLENFYAAMVPATGSIQTSDSTVFNYQLAENSKAMVHTGWLVGLSNLAPTVLEQINKYYAKGVKEFIIMGHSQGGALAFMLRSYLFYLTEKGSLPKDLIFKTYCSAAPKPGNLYYAYDYDYITRNGWGYTVVNALDWVPETPFTVQTLDDFNKLNPFVNAKKGFNNLPFLPRIFLKHKYNKIDKSTRKAQKQLKKNLGGLMYTRVKKAMPQYQQPQYVNGMNYMRAGSPIILMPDEAYKNEYPDDGKNVFKHHMLVPYVILAKKYLENKD